MKNVEWWSRLLSYLKQRQWVRSEFERKEMIDRNIFSLWGQCCHHPHVYEVYIWNLTFARHLLRLSTRYRDYLFLDGTWIWIARRSGTGSTEHFRFPALRVHSLWDRQWHTLWIFWPDHVWDEWRCGTANIDTLALCTHAVWPCQPYLPIDGDTLWWSTEQPSVPVVRANRSLRNCPNVLSKNAQTSFLEIRAYHSR